MYVCMYKTRFFLFVLNEERRPKFLPGRSINYFTILYTRYQVPVIYYLPSTMYVCADWKKPQLALISRIYSIK